MTPISRLFKNGATIYWMYNTHITLYYYYYHNEYDHEITLPMAFSVCIFWKMVPFLHEMKYYIYIIYKMKKEVNINNRYFIFDCTNSNSYLTLVKILKSYLPIPNVFFSCGLETLLVWNVTRQFVRIFLLKYSSTTPHCKAHLTY